MHVLPAFYTQHVTCTCHVCLLIQPGKHELIGNKHAENGESLLVVMQIFDA